jgi:CheY-like chemotaxis protein
MSEDLVSLRMVLIGAAQPDQELWRQAVTLASVMIEFTVHDASSAARAVGETGADICIVDDLVSDATKTAVVEVARKAQPAPLVFVSAPKGAARTDGVDGQFHKPADVAEARKMVESCVRAKLSTRVLILDDSATMRSIVRKILLASRFTLDIQESAEGIDALNKLRGGNFGLVFLDHNMPGLNGFDMLAQIKREIPDIAVVMMSSTLEQGIPEKARAKGALDFLKKPFFPADTDAMLARFYGLHAAHK